VIGGIASSAYVAQVTATMADRVTAIMAATLKRLLLPITPWASHDVFEMWARKSQRGEVLRGVRCALGLDVRQLRSPAFPDR
jgi:hypothetical protein